jgi:tetratricopeptide (TPR) repeat protein
LRKALDEAVETTQGPGYQQLKNEFGALKSIEKDVNRRAGVHDRGNIKGLLDFSDLFSGHELVRGILTMRPEVMATAGVVKGLKNYYKYLNNPNRIVKTMFTKAEKAMAPQTKKILPTMPQRAIGYEGVRGLPVAQPEAQGNTPTPQSNLLGSALGAMTPSAYAGEPPTLAETFDRYGSLEGSGVPPYPTGPAERDYQDPAKGLYTFPKPQELRVGELSPTNTTRTVTMGSDPLLGIPKATTPLSSSSAKAGVKAYFNRDYNNAIKSFGQAMTENPANAEEYTKAINMAMKEQKELGKFGAQGASQQKKTSPLEQPATAEPQTLSGIFNDLSFSRKAYAEEPKVPTLSNLKGKEPSGLTFERQGTQAYLQGNYADAINAFKKAIEENPENAEKYKAAINQIMEEIKGMQEIRKQNMYTLPSLDRVGRALETQI